MDVLSAIKKRREITKFRPDPIPGEAMNTLLQSLYLAPSGNNLPSREFIVIQNKETLAALAETTPYMKWLQQASAGIAIISNPKISKYWLQDASIAGGYLWLTAASLGLGAAWGAVYHSEDEAESKKREDYARKHLKIPGDYCVVAILGLGYPAHEPPAKEMIPMEQVLHHETF
ncbi:nitroreductase family protein [Thermoactinomyces intermedius]|jgi:nitroreductase|uniref:Nitroreductase family protein n=1 Tax=Thermoactinomyces intermedius TaxID=2024 RepID=A0A8I1AFM1_THEIN|nr:nitroreductase family protein [Thermoactinomyces intermedius]MBA4548284.1 nitroreductase family protein [Thermoactinomyces intermedius]MBA4835152.1 nitroreductase family protein [Thermoactinomyces intermedius]MBH8595128.1 nitroreductase family protein [Thermoactinomyces intermedius]